MPRATTTIKKKKKKHIHNYKREVTIKEHSMSDHGEKRKEMR
jgi:hypothetical protein